MNRPLTLVLAALDAVVTAAIGIGIVLVPATLLWAVQFGLALDWTDFWRASADVWLLGHGVDLRVTLSSDLAVALGLPGADAPFEIGLALLGFALLTLVLGHRSGRRIGASDGVVLGVLGGAVAFAAVATLVALSAASPSAAPSLPQSVLLPAGVYVVGLLSGLAWRSRAPRGEPTRFAALWRSRLARIDPGDRALAALALRGGGMAAFGVLTIAAVALAVLLVTGFASIVSLYEGLHTEVVGGIALTVGQLTLLPNLVVWAASWFIGPGFAIGTGSTVSPLGTQLGLVPSVPILGALPQGDLPLGFAGLLVPVLVAFAVGAVLKPQVDRALAGRHGGERWIRLAAVAVVLGLVGSLVLALLAMWSGGAAGPGRLTDVGPDPGAVLLWSFPEIALASALGLLSGATLRRPRPDAEGTAQRADTL